MEIKHFLSSWQGAISENKFHRILLVGQSIALVIALIGWQTKDRVTVVVPPKLSEKAEISKKTASVTYKKSWSLYVAEMMGNITPSNVEFIVESLASLMNGETQAKFKTMAAIEIDNIKRNGMTVSFEPRSITYERETDKVFIGGNSVVQAAGSQQPQSFTRIFEVMIDINNGIPIISHLDTYQGAPKTRDLLLRLEKEAANLEKTKENIENKKRLEDRLLRRDKKEQE
jgi:conjugal transfer pilus assembly protein TraE